MKRNKHPLRDATPFELASWLDAYTIEPSVDWGRPGFADLRDAWAGHRTHEDVLDALPSWLERQAELQQNAQSVYEALLAVEPIRSDEGAIAAWFPTPWAEVLLSKPWDERLESAIAEAATYLSARV